LILLDLDDIPQFDSIVTLIGVNPGRVGSVTIPRFWAGGSWGRRGSWGSRTGRETLL